MVYLESGYSDSSYHIENLVNRTKIILNIKIILSGLNEIQGELFNIYPICLANAFNRLCCC